MYIKPSTKRIFLQEGLRKQHYVEEPRNHPHLIYFELSRLLVVRWVGAGGELMSVFSKGTNDDHDDYDDHDGTQILRIQRIIRIKETMFFC